MPQANDDRNSIVIGGGVVGLTTAIFLLRCGYKVTLIDPLPSPGGASYGNAGMISPQTTVPISLPGMLRQVPSWLMSPQGPLVVKPSYFPKALPWLMKWISAGRMKRVLKISDAMRMLHQDAFVHWKELLGDAYDELVRHTGQAHVWETPGETKMAALERKLRERHGIRSEELSRSDIERLFPGISSKILRGILLPGNGHTISPARLVRTLAAIFEKEGGRRLYQTVAKIIPDDPGRGYTVMSNIANHRAAIIVVAAGAYSSRILRPLGIQAPLEAERGYHITFANHGLNLGATLSHKNRSFGLTQMQDGLRVAGTVEIAGLDAAPDERRALMLIDHIRDLFPDVQTADYSYWMGIRPSLPDSLPVIGESRRHKGIFFNFGHGHFGMTSAPASGRLIAQLANREKTLADPELFALDRPTVSGVP